jgi:hypothetical protein
MPRWLQFTVWALVAAAVVGSQARLARLVVVVVVVGRGQYPAL